MIGGAMMTAPDQIRARYERCMPHLAQLQMLTADEAAAPLPPGAARQVAEITRIVLAETEAAGQAIAASTSGAGQAVQATPFLAARLARMAAAARYAVTAAEAGDAAAFRRQSRLFGTLTSATWTVQDALRPRPGGQRPASRSARRISA